MSLRKERYEKYELQRFSKLGEDKEPCLECSIQGRPQEHRWQAYYEKLILGLRRYVDEVSQQRADGHRFPLGITRFPLILVAAWIKHSLVSRQTKMKQITK